MECNKCTNEVTNLRYIATINGCKHLVGDCPFCGVSFLPFVKDLNIKTKKSKRLQKEDRIKEKKERNPTLFELKELTNF